MSAGRSAVRRGGARPAGPSVATRERAPKRAACDTPAGIAAPARRPCRPAPSRTRSRRSEPAVRAGRRLVKGAASACQPDFLPALVAKRHRQPACLPSSARPRQACPRRQRPQRRRALPRSPTPIRDTDGGARSATGSKRVRHGGNRHRWKNRCRTAYHAYACTAWERNARGAVTARGARTFRLCCGCAALNNPLVRGTMQAAMATEGYPALTTCRHSHVPSLSWISSSCSGCRSTRTRLVTKLAPQRATRRRARPCSCADHAYEIWPPPDTQSLQLKATPYSRGLKGQRLVHGGLHGRPTPLERCRGSLPSMHCRHALPPMHCRHALPLRTAAR
eukprot:364319-Chlamydomonas_euryale.AAC.4